MAGKRHHYLPRFLMRGFLAKGVKGKDKTFVYHKVRGLSLQTTIDDVGVEGYFYGSREDTSVDDQITQQEMALYSHVVSDLRSKSNGEFVSSDKVAGLLANLIIRTKRTRAAVIGGSNSIAWMLDKLTGDSRFAEKALNDAADPAHGRLESAIDTHAAKRGLKLSTEQKNALADGIRSEIKNNFDFALDEARQHMGDLSNAFKPADDLDAKRVHIDALRKGIEPAARVEDIVSRQWEIIHFNDDLILGDSPVVGFLSDASSADPLMLQKELSVLSLPISSRAALLGFRSDRIPIDADILNLASAKLAREFFISSWSRKEHSSLIPLIGRLPELFSKDEVIGYMEEKLYSEHD